MEILLFIVIAVIGAAIAAVVDITVGLGTVVDALKSSVRSLRKSPIRRLVNKEVNRRQQKANEDALCGLHLQLSNRMVDLPAHIAEAIQSELREIRFQHYLNHTSIKKAVKQTDRVEYELNRALQLLK